MKTLTKKDLLKYKIDTGNVKKLTGVEADLYIFTIYQINELLKEEPNIELQELRDSNTMLRNQVQELLKKFEPKPDTSDLESCYESLIRSNHLSREWEKHYESWHNGKQPDTSQVVSKCCNYPIIDGRCERCLTSQVEGMTAEKVLINKVHKMCIESLPPSLFEKWESITSELKKNRKL
jgi:glutamate racemase